MKRTFSYFPDENSYSPFLGILPVVGSANDLAGLTESLFARNEKVSALLADSRDAAPAELRKRLLLEQGMLRQVLDWLKVES